MKSLKNTFWLVSKINTMLHITILLAKNVFYYCLFAALVTHYLLLGTEVKSNPITALDRP
jgi:hypothetical protein